jgi:hypothetical protein
MQFQLVCLRLALGPQTADVAPPTENLRHCSAALVSLVYNGYCSICGQRHLGGCGCRSNVGQRCLRAADSWTGLFADMHSPADRAFWHVRQTLSVLALTAFLIQLLSNCSQLANTLPSVTQPKISLLHSQSPTM